MIRRFCNGAALAAVLWRIALAADSSSELSSECGISCVPHGVDANEIDMIETDTSLLQKEILIGSIEAAPLIGSIDGSGMDHVRSGARTQAAVSFRGKAALVVAIVSFGALLAIIAGMMLHRNLFSGAGRGLLERQGNVSSELKSGSAPLSSHYFPPTAGAGAADSIGGPPPICQSLILPNTEARFLISMPELLRITTGSLAILGTSGRELLHITIDDSDDGRRCLKIASVGGGAQAGARIVVYATNGVMDVHGRNGKPYGTIEPSSSSTRSVLLYQGTPVLNIEMGDPADLRMIAAHPSNPNKVLAQAGRTEGGTRFPQGGEAWMLQVKPGVDAVLIGASMLAILLLKPRPLSVNALAPSSRAIPASIQTPGR